MPKNNPNYMTDVDTEVMRVWMDHGWSPEEAAMIARLAASGLHVPLAAVAARQIMGLGDKESRKKEPKPAKRKDVSRVITPNDDGSITAGPPVTDAQRMAAASAFRPGMTINHDQSLTIPTTPRQAPTPPVDPNVAWDNYAREHPLMANSKKLLVKGSEPLRDLGKAITKPVVKDTERASRENERIAAHKMLKDYLQAQDAVKANEAAKEGLWMLTRMPGAALAGRPVYMGPTTPAERNIAFASQGNVPPPQYDLDVGPVQMTPQYDLDIGPVQMNQARRR